MGTSPEVPVAPAAHDGSWAALPASVEFCRRLLQAVLALEAAAKLGRCRAELPELGRSSGCGRQGRSWLGAQRRYRGSPEKTIVAVEAKRCTKALNLFLIA